MARRLLTIGHAYGVRLNRRWTHELAQIRQGREWEVTVVAPSYFHGANDLRPIEFQADVREPVAVERVDARLTRRVHVFHYAKSLREILNDKGRNGWDIVHAWEEPYIVVGGQIASWTPRRTPLVFTTFQNINKSYPPPFSWIERYAMERAAGWSCCGATVANALKNRPGYGGRPMRIIPLGVDTHTFRPDLAAGQAVRRQLDWAVDDAPVVGFLGRFNEPKGLRVLMAALDLVKVPWRALFVGAGELEPELRSWGDQWGPERVQICTKVGHDQVPSYLNAMDILAAPSLTTPQWREQFGRMLVEGFACGIPVIGSDSGEIPYVIGDAGLIVPEGDVSHWAQSLASMLVDSRRRRELREAGLDRAHTRFSWPVVASQYDEFFQEILGSHK